MQTFISLNQFACFKKEINLVDLVNQLISSITACESAGLKDDRLLSVDRWAWMKGAILIGFMEHFLKIYYQVSHREKRMLSSVNIYVLYYYNLDYDDIYGLRLFFSKWSMVLK